MPFAELKSLQILRIMAALSVVYYHISASFGSFGVDIFFVISGFVIAMVSQKTPNVMSFARARIIRIVPLYWLLTTGLLFLALIKPDLLNSTTANFTHYCKSLLFIPYFKENGALHPMLAVGWTLNYEMFFYFCTGLALLISRQFYIPVTLGLLAASYLGLGQFIGSDTAAVFFNNSLIFEFTLGMLAFLLFQRKMLPPLPKTVLIFIALSFYLFMAGAEFLHLEINRFWLYGIPSLFLVLSMITLENVFRSKSPRLVQALVLLGNASYAIYLSHYYVIEGIKKIVYPSLNIITPNYWGNLVLMLGTSLLIGCLLYRWIDKPLVGYFKQKRPPVYVSREAATF